MFNAGGLQRRPWLPTFAAPEDSHLLHYKDEAEQLEISLDTTGYTPEELAVKVEGGELVVRGSHEEKTQTGQVAVARQFSRRYTLPAEAKLAAVQSNLSQDGVMVITVPKEKRIQEVKEGQKLRVEHNHSDADSNRNVKRERNISSGSESSSKKDNVAKERKFSSSDSESSKKESRSESRNSSNSSRRESMVPLTVRESFFDDPFFKDTWLDIERSQKEFFERSRQQFEESVARMDSELGTASWASERPHSFGSPASGQTRSSLEWLHPGPGEAGSSAELRVSEDKTRLEVQLDTAGYKPDELKVTAGRGIICVEGKHEEKTEAGKVMVSRQFSRQYGLPADCRAEDVVSNLSQDGVLLVTVPKAPALRQDKRQVPIKTTSK